MAFGNNNGQNNSSRDANYYSRLRISNYNDSLSLNFTYWSGLLKLAIVQFSQDSMQSSDRTELPQSKQECLLSVLKILQMIRVMM